MNVCFVEIFHEKSVRVLLISMEQKPGWSYKFISSLNMHIAINDTTGVMYTEDKIKYSQEEQLMLKSIDYQIPLSVHLIKKVFDGTIISVK